MSDASVTFLISRLGIASVEFLIVGFLAALVLALFKGITPRWRRTIWLLVLCKPLITIVTGFLGGLIPVPSVVTGRLLGSVLFPPAGEHGLIGAEGAAGALLSFIAYTWLIVTLLLLARVWLRLVASRQLIDESNIKGYTLKPSTLKRLDPTLEIPPHAQIVVTPEDAGPAAMGILKPAVIVPESLVPWVNKHRDPSPQERARLCQVLRHEITHITNRDSLISLFASILVSLFWFHPIAHWAYRRVRLNNELCCDEQVVDGGVAVGAYVDTLMNIVAGEFSRRASMMRLLGDVSPQNVLRKRLQYLLASSERTHPPRRRMTVAVVVLLALLMPRFLADAPGEIVRVIMPGGEERMIPLAQLDRYPGAVLATDSAWDRELSIVLAGGSIERPDDGLGDGLRFDPEGTVGPLFGAVEPEAPSVAMSGEADMYADAADKPEETEKAVEPRRRSTPRQPVWGTAFPTSPETEHSPILPPPG